MSKRIKKGYERNMDKTAEKLVEAMDYFRQELVGEPSPEEVAEIMETPVEIICKRIGKGDRGTAKDVLVVNNSVLTAGDEVVYDDMRALVCCVQIERFVDILALNGMVLRGVFGTSIRSLIEYIRGLRYETKELIGKKITRERTMQLSDEYNAYIFASFNSGSNPLSGIHTMCVTREGRDFTLHNDYNGNKSYTSLYEAILSYKDGNTNPIILIGIR
jgi:hypothetical protein